MRFERLHRQWWFWGIVLLVGYLPIHVMRAAPPIDVDAPDRLLRQYEERHRREGEVEAFAHGDRFHLLNRRFANTGQEPAGDSHDTTVGDLLQLADELRDGGWMRMRIPAATVDSIRYERLRTVYTNELPRIAADGDWDTALRELEEHFAATIPLARSGVDGYFRATQVRRNLWTISSILLRREMEEDVLQRLVQLLDVAIESEPTPTPDMLLNYYDEIRAYNEGENPYTTTSGTSWEIYSLMTSLTRGLDSGELAGLGRLEERQRWVNGRRSRGFFGYEGLSGLPTYWLEIRVISRELQRFLVENREVFEQLSPFPGELIDDADPRDYPALVAPPPYSAFFTAFIKRIHKDMHRVHLLGARARLHKMQNGNWPSMEEILPAEDRDGAIMEYEIREFAFPDPPEAPEYIHTNSPASIWLRTLFQNPRSLREARLLPADESGRTGFTIRQFVSANSWPTDAISLQALHSLRHITAISISWVDGGETVVLEDLEGWDWILPEGATNIVVEVSGRFPATDMAITSRFAPQFSGDYLRQLYRSPHQPEPGDSTETTHRIYFIGAVE